MTALPDVMPAAVYQSPGVVTVEDRPVPRPGPGQVLVEVDHCGICGSDIHILLEGWGNQPGLIAGHEYTGIIAAVGDGVDGLGSRRPDGRGPVAQVRPLPPLPRGQALAVREPRGSSTDCHDGAFARYIVVRAAALLRLPDGISPREAALAEPLAVALHGITRSGIVRATRAMVIGAGPIGALTIAALVARGIGPVTAVEPSEKRTGAGT